VLLRIKVPKSEHKVEVETERDGFLVLNGKKYPIDGEVSELIVDMLEELIDLRDMVNIYENEFSGQRGEA
jgi:hypothetical protein|tara:strand:- start:1990 stop:2199 length:210 start_codon:yes stop_codon:yes gene_type:complete